MGEIHNSSFIPKNTTRAPKRVNVTRRRVYVLSYISYVVFFGTLLATIGIMFYSIQITKALEASRVQLEDQRVRFTETNLDGVRGLEKKLKAARQTLNDLHSPSKIFTEIEATIADNIRLVSFTYEYFPNRQFLLSLAGETQGFGEIINQDQVFSESKLLGAGEVITFDYAPAESEEEGEDIPVLSSDALIQFTYEGIYPSSIIPFDPTGALETENQVTGIRTGGDSEETVVDTATTTNSVSDEAADDVDGFSASSSDTGTDDESNNSQQ